MSGSILRCLNTAPAMLQVSFRTYISTAPKKLDLPQSFVSEIEKSQKSYFLERGPGGNIATLLFWGSIYNFIRRLIVKRQIGNKVREREWRDTQQRVPAGIDWVTLRLRGWNHSTPPLLWSGKPLQPRC